MGFFSRIKKLWARGESDAPAPSSAQGAQTPTPKPPSTAPAHEAPAVDWQTTSTQQAKSHHGPLPTAKPASLADPETSTAQVPQSPDSPGVPQTEAPLCPAAPQPHLGPEPTLHPSVRQESTTPPSVPTAPKSTARPSLWQRLWGHDTKERKEDVPRKKITHAASQAQDEASPLDFQEKTTLAPWQTELARALRDAEPRLSVWMEHILAGVMARGPELWARLRFLFSQLDAPENEAEDFIRRFDSWLSDMGYEAVEDFRSELQYRLALALDLEDEEDERSRLLLKLSQGLAKTRSQLTARIENLLARTSSYDAAFWEELEEILLVADVGVTASSKLLERLKKRVRHEGSTPQDFKSLLKEEISAVFPPAPAPVEARPEVVLLVGVNGAGKTTTIAKLAHRAQMQGRRVLVAAGDTFRAAAIEQLEVWARRVGAGFYAKQHGADPAAVAFEAVERAQAEGYDLVLVDTAGRLQTKHNLMEELSKIARVLGKKLPGAPHRTVLVLDATTGQNALSQARLFSQAAPVTEIILTKLDGTAKGGVIVGVALEFGIPISFVGLGEKMEDLRPFLAEEFAAALLGEQK